MLKLSLVVFPVCRPKRVSVSFPVWVQFPLCCFSQNVFSSYTLFPLPLGFLLLFLFFLFFFISCICRCLQLFCSQCTSHLSITLSVPADKHLPTDEEKRDSERGKEGRSSTAVDYRYGSGRGHYKIQEDKQLHQHTHRGTVCNWHMHTYVLSFTVDKHMSMLTFISLVIYNILT